ncbi:hypothetical protein ACFLXO_04780 [Chloroflexota bacterium]
MIRLRQYNQVIEVMHLGELRFSIPDELHKELKKMALDKGVSLKRLINDIFELYTKDIAKQGGDSSDRQS